MKKSTRLFKWLTGSMLLSLSSVVTAQVMPASIVSSIDAVSTSLDGARVGVFVNNTNTNQQWGYNGDQRFPTASTFKVLACAAALDKGALSKTVMITEKDLVEYSPVTGKHLNKTLTYEQLCHATITTSDNTAGNLVLKYVGGPEGLTQFLRGTGDSVTLMSRWEPELNQGTPGDKRDTTTPAAINRTLDALLFGDVLSKPKQQQLLQWMKQDQVADDLLRSVLPKTWQIGDKTGAGGHGSRGIIAVLIPPKSKPVLVSIYITESQTTIKQLNKAIATIGSAIIKELEATLD
ncbi:class A beta-lactamase [Vibrio ostreicida]|uniref:class A beta-lactamase n=1 Tax=Vibrio ostreicida TaxID=526588 RepID=UPI003B5ABBAA